LAATRLPLRPLREALRADLAFKQNIYLKLSNCWRLVFYRREQHKEDAVLFRLQCTVFLEGRAVCAIICQTQRPDPNVWMLHFPRSGRDFLLTLHPSKEQQQPLRPPVSVGRGKGECNQAIYCNTSSDYCFQ